MELIPSRATALRGVPFDWIRLARCKQYRRKYLITKLTYTPHSNERLYLPDLAVTCDFVRNITVDWEENLRPTLLVIIRAKKENERRAVDDWVDAEMYCNAKSRTQRP